LQIRGISSAKQQSLEPKRNDLLIQKRTEIHRVFFCVPISKRRALSQDSRGSGLGSLFGQQKLPKTNNAQSIPDLVAEILPPSPLNAESQAVSRTTRVVSLV
jgi:hypothetical protein